jgi:small subunit ribosomal protein S18
MARKNNRNPLPTRGRRQEFRRGKPRPCTVCPTGSVDWKDTSTLRKYTSDRGKIRGRRVTGLCPQCQREVAVAIKNAREMALLPYMGGR